MAETIAPGTTRYLCPLRCGWHHDVPPPTAADTAGIPVPPDVTDLSGAISYLAGESTRRTAATTEAALVAHLDTHTIVEFVTVIEWLHSEIRQLTPAPAAEESRAMSTPRDLGRAAAQNLLRTDPLSEASIDLIADAVMNAYTPGHRDEVLRERRRAILAASLAGPVDEASAANPVWTHGYKAGLSVAADLTTPAPSGPGGSR